MSYFEKVQVFYSPGDRALHPLQRRLKGQDKIGYISTLSVASPFCGRGVATALVDRCISDLKAKGVNLLVATAWEVNGHVRTASILAKRGFQDVLTVGDYWK